MRRAGLIYCADCGEPQFKAMRARDQLPFFTDDVSEARWQDFTLSDAFELRLMLDLTQDHGVGTDLARYVVVNGIYKLSMHPLNYPRTEGDMWVAAALVTEPNPEIEESHWRFAIAGRLNDLPKMATDHIDANFHGSELVRIVSANASRAAEFVRKRALEMGLPEGEDFSSVRESWEWPEWVDRTALAELNGEDQ